MKAKNRILSGVVGALVLNMVHELAKHSFKNAPSIDKVGKDGLVKGTKAIGITPPQGKALDGTVLAFNLLVNSLSYSLIGTYSKGNLLTKGALHGAGVGLATLSGSYMLDVDDKPLTHTQLTKILTVTWYVIGGIVAAGIMQYVDNKSKIGFKTCT